MSQGPPSSWGIVSFLKRILFLDGLEQIKRERQGNQASTLKTIMPLQQQQTLQESANRFQQYLQVYHQAQLTGKQIFRALVKTHSGTAIKAIIYFLLINSMLVLYGGMYALFFDSWTYQQYHDAYKAILYLSLGLILNNFFTANGYHQVGTLTVSMKGTLFHQLYTHILSLPTSLLQPELQGNIISIVTQFQYLMEESAYTTFRTITSPIAVIGLGILLVSRHGWATLVGVVLCMLFEVIHFFLAGRNSRYLVEVNKLKDKRIQSLSQIVFSLEEIKMQRWQILLLGQAREIRKEEVSFMQKYSSGLSLQTAMGEGVAFMSYILTLGSLNVFSGKTITIQICYTIVFFILMVRRISQSITAGITNYYSYSLLFDGVAAILNIKTLNNSQVRLQMENDSKDIIVQMDEVSFRYDEQSLNVFEKVDLKVKRGDFMVIAGKVASGKTTLLQLLANHLQPTQGHITSNTRNSYVLREPFLFSGTVKSNIILNHNVDKKQYQTVLEVCSLTEDLVMLEAGDQTRVEENNKNISDGQKARIALARALYSQRDLIILNDPMSYFDINMGQKIVDNLKRMCQLQGKTIIMAVHSSYFLKDANRLIAIKDRNLIQIKRESLNSLLETTRGMPQRRNSLLDNRSSQLLQTHLGNIKEPEDVKSQSDEAYPHHISYHRSLESRKSEGEKKGLEEPRFFHLLFKYFFLSRKNWVLFPLTIFWFALSQALSAYISNFLLYQFSLRNQNNHEFFHDFGIIYGVIAILTFVFLLIRSYFLTLCIQNSNKYLYKKAIRALIFASLQSQRGQSSGSSLDKLSQDIGMLDNNIAANLDMQLVMFFQCFYNLFMLILFKPILTIFGALIVLGSLFVYTYCAPVVLSERKLSLSLKSTPILNQFSELLKGHKSIKIYDQESFFKGKLQKSIYNSQQAAFSYHRTLMTFKFFNQNILLIAQITMLIVTIDILIHSPIGIFCSSLISLFGVFLYFDFMLCQSIVINNVLTCMERISKFTQRKEEQAEGPSLEQEEENIASKEVIQDETQAKQQIAIDIRDLELKLPAEQKSILRGIDVRIRKGEKVAIVGRSGSGKTSFINSLYQLIQIDLTCSYSIFGHNVHSLPLNQLRSYFTFITQHPFIFQDTVRKNIDPFDILTDDQVINALREVKLLETIQQSKKGILSSLEEKQIELSYGQRQLLTMARVLARKAPILIMDEATFYLDQRTDSIIQSLLRKRFKAVTIINATERLGNVLDYDKILVFDRGQIVEQGNSHQLLEQKGLFFDMVTENQQLKRISSQYNQRRVEGNSGEFSI